mgnify:CR=1 FL=1
MAKRTAHGYLVKDTPSNQTGYKPGGGPGRQGNARAAQTTRRGQLKAKTPTAKELHDPLLYKEVKVKTAQGYTKTKWVRRASPKKAKPLDKSKKKGSPRSYENLKKSKPLGKGRNKGVG